MVHFMAEAFCLFPGYVEGNRFALFVEGAHLYPVRALELAPAVGEAQAAFDDLLLSLGFHDFGVNQLDQTISHVNDHQPLENAYLGSGQPCADLRMVHRFGHVVEQLTDFIVDLGDRAAFLAQYWVVV